MGQRKFKKPFELCSFSEIFYCGMIRLRNTNWDVFIQCEYTKSVYRNETMGQSVFKNIQNFQNLIKYYTVE